MGYDPDSDDGIIDGGFEDSEEVAADTHTPFVSHAFPHGADTHTARPEMLEDAPSLSTPAVQPARRARIRPMPVSLQRRWVDVSMVVLVKNNGSAVILAR
jgi:hypothetical protein